MNAGQTLTVVEITVLALAVVAFIVRVWYELHRSMQTPPYFPPSPEIFTDATVHWHTHRTPEVLRRLATEAAERADKQAARHTAHLGES